VHAGRAHVVGHRHVVMQRDEHRRQRRRHLKRNGAEPGSLDGERSINLPLRAWSLIHNKKTIALFDNTATRL
jgi:hypothetical protein